METDVECQKDKIEENARRIQKEQNISYTEALRVAKASLKVQEKIKNLKGETDDQV